MTSTNLLSLRSNYTRVAEEKKDQKKSVMWFGMLANLA